MRRDDDSDAAIIPVASLGEWADREELALVPPAFRRSGHPFQWTGLLPAYREHLIEWGGQAQALPIGGDSRLLIVRRDRLEEPAVRQAYQQRYGRPPAVPATWEELADLAAVLSAVDGRPALPAMSAEAWADSFFRIAACYDRPAITDAAQAQAAPLQFDPFGGDARLDAPAFGQAARLLARLVAEKALPPPAATPLRPGAALAKGQAMLAVAELVDLEHLPLEHGVVAATYAVAALPGSTGYFDGQGRFVRTVTPNYVPYYAGGWVGVVRRQCSRPEDAFDLLGELGGPARSLELLSTPRLNAGPFRSIHLEQERLVVWYHYRLDAERTRQLQDALRSYVRAEVKNPVLGLRAPDQAQLQRAAVRELERLRHGASPQEVVRDLAAAWRQIDATTPQAVRKRWRQPSAGFGE